MAIAPDDEAGHLRRSIFSISGMGINVFVLCGSSRRMVRKMFAGAHELCRDNV